MLLRSILKSSVLEERLFEVSVLSHRLLRLVFLPRPVSKSSELRERLSDLLAVVPVAVPVVFVKAACESTSSVVGEP